MKIAAPKKITFHKSTSELEVKFESAHYFFRAEFLRVYSPSAEVQGHGPGQKILQLNKENVTIHKITPAGRYGIRLHFSDAHNTGIYSWSYLDQLGKDQDTLWRQYCQEVEQSQMQKLTWIDAEKKT